MEPGWRGRGLAFLRVVAFAAVFIAANLAMHPALAPLHARIKTPEGHMLLEMAVLAIITAALTALFARLSGRSFASYGLGGSNGARNLGIGLAAGIGLLAIQLVIENALGVFSFGPASPVDGTLLTGAALVGAWCLATGLTEETLFRGYALVETSRAVSLWPAVIGLSVLFGIPHWLKGEGENFIGGMQAALIGLGLAWSFRTTGSLWLAIGFHAGWNFAQSFLFGVPDSGTVATWRLLHPVLHGSPWLNGGNVGAEGSVLVVIPFLGLLAIAWAMRQRSS